MFFCFRFVQKLTHWSNRIENKKNPCSKLNIDFNISNYPTRSVHSHYLYLDLEIVSNVTKDLPYCSSDYVSHLFETYSYTMMVHSSFRLSLILIGSKQKQQQQQHRSESDKNVRTCLCVIITKYTIKKIKSRKKKGRRTTRTEDVCKLNRNSRFEFYNKKNKREI